MERVAHLGVIDPEIPAEGVDAHTVWRGDEIDGALHLVEERQHVTGITRIARGHPMGKDKTGRGFGEETRFPPKLGWTIAFPFQDRCNRGVIRIDDFAVLQPFALGQTLGLFRDLPMGNAGGFQVAQQALALGLTEGSRVVQEGFRLLGPGLNGPAESQQVPFGLAHQRDEDFALAPALPTKTPHDLLQGLVQRMRLVAQWGRGERRLPRDPLDELQAFFWALYSVVASVTR